MSDVILYDKSNLSKLIVPNNYAARYTAKFITPLIKYGTQKYIKNVDTKMALLKIDDMLLPVAISDYNSQNSYVCSLFTHYISYAKVELKELRNKPLESVLKCLLSLLGLLFKACDIDRCVYVNNWLLSTNLYHHIKQNDLVRITHFLKDRFKDYAIVFRSLNTKHNFHILSALDELGFRRIVSRKVYIFDQVSNISSKYRYMVNKDMKMIKSSNLTLLRSAKAAGILELYNMLYLQKYSLLNPQFSEDFITHILENQLMNFGILSDENNIKAVYAYFKRDGVMTAPIFGHDTGVDIKTGLYRILTAMLIKEANEQNLAINMSSGAGDFKYKRGAKPYLEKNAILYSHLPFYRRLPFYILEFITTKFANSLMKNTKI